MTSFTFFSSYPLDTTVCYQFAFFSSEYVCISFMWNCWRLLLFSKKKKKKRHVNYYYMCYAMRRCYHYCLTDINHFEIVGSQMKFYAFLALKKKWFFLSHALWFGLLFFLSLQWARKFFIKKKMKKPFGANLFRECLYVFVCIQYTYKGWAIILRRAIFFPVSQYSK